MNREMLEEKIKRYNTILRYIVDDRTVLVLKDMIAETRDRLREFGQTGRSRYGRVNVQDAD
jgi:hypothetical protein